MVEACNEKAQGGWWHGVDDDGRNDPAGQQAAELSLGHGLVLRKAIISASPNPALVEELGG